MNEQEDFVMRCKYLESKFNFIMLSETSPRVWVSAISLKLCEILSKQNNPLAGLDQVKLAMDVMVKELTKEREDG